MEIKKIFFVLYLVFIITGCGNEKRKKNIGEKIWQYPQKVNIEKLYESNNSFRNGEGAFLKLENNILAYVYTCFENRNGDDDSANICIIKSFDKNRKLWTKPKILIYNHAIENIMSVSLLRKDDNSILIQYLAKNSCNNLRIIRRYSYDELKNLSQPYELDIGDGYNVVDNDRLLYYNNKIYTPISKHTCKNNDFNYSGIMELAITDDKNDNNITIIKIKNDSNITLQEPGIVKLKGDGNLLMWFRNNTNNMLISISQDYGKHFSKIHSTIIKTVPYSTANIKSFNDDLFIVYNKWSLKNKNYSRIPLVLAISRDNLKTINNEYILENNNTKEYMYPSIYKDGLNLIIAYMIQYKTNFKLKIIKLNRIFQE
jgi:hypothetical protein